MAAGAKAKGLKRAFVVALAVGAAILGMGVRVSFDWLFSRASPTPTSTESPAEIDSRTEQESARDRDFDDAQAGLLDLSRAFERVALEVVPSVVTITCGGRSFGGSTGGSGIILASDGIIITNFHVIESELPAGRDISCRLFDGRRFDVQEIVGYDEDSDIAVLRIEATDLRAVRLGDSDNARVGQWVICIGNAEGLEGTVTHGIVSAVGRRGVIARTKTPDDMIQTDAAINRGNSGGPLVNLHGQVIGMNTVILSPTGGSVGLGFAIPINVVKRMLDDILEYGSVTRGGLGVYRMDDPDVIKLGADPENLGGALVGSVIAGSAAAVSGVEEGDLIVAFNGRAIGSFERLAQLVAYTKPGTEATLTVRRGRGWTTQIGLKVTIGTLRSQTR